MKTRWFGVAAVLGAVGAGFCCLGPVIFSILGVSTVVSLTTLRFVVLYRNAFFAATVVALALAVWSVIARRGRASSLEWAILGGSTIAVVALVAYTIRIEGWPW
jgi:predicted transporter